MEKRAFSVALLWILSCAVCLWFPVRKPRLGEHNVTLTLPYAAHFFTSKKMFFVSFVAPLCTLYILSGNKKRKSIEPFLFSQAGAVFFCLLLKYTLLVPRPSFYSCLEKARGEESVSLWSRITGDKTSIGCWLSFPSNHAVFIVTGAGHLLLSVLSGNTPANIPLKDRLALYTILPLITLAVAVSRILENHHRPVDVLGGMAIGMSFSIVSLATYTEPAVY
ncbi:MAG: phosphatidic acid phosphatase type 2 domain-containing protein [Amphiamblys sp. WSBS2006]|nr:MAG: phosphatidic acid phosphatase type 2 domain-containing protein [Amphiamblys sp. WSBS2006]